MAKSKYLVCHLLKYVKYDFTLEAVLVVGDVRGDGMGGCYLQSGLSLVS